MHSVRQLVAKSPSSRFAQVLHNGSRSGGRVSSAVATPNTPTSNCKVAAAFFSSDSITYSGGQATEGQGGFYGSGGARKLDINASNASSSPSSSSNDSNTPNDPRPQMLALAADVTNITNTMKEVETLEQLLHDETTTTNNSGEISGRTIEIKSKIKKACTNPEFMESLNRLELNGEPIWGLSGDEREMIMNARTKVNEC